MKRLLFLFLLLSVIFFSFGCEESASDGSTASGSDTTNTPSAAESWVPGEEPDKSTTAAEESYPFLLSEYTVTSIRESNGTVYTCDYYFVDGVVAGARLTALFADEETATNYFIAVSEDYPDSVLDGTSVTNYMADDDAFYFGYTPEKLKFMLDTAGYKYTVNFDENLFAEEFSAADD